jgi:hypothetical protein
MEWEGVHYESCFSGLTELCVGTASTAFLEKLHVPLLPKEITLRGKFHGRIYDIAECYLFICGLMNSELETMRKEAVVVKFQVLTGISSEKLRLSCMCVCVCVYVYIYVKLKYYFIRNVKYSAFKKLMHYIKYISCRDV